MCALPYSASSSFLLLYSRTGPRRALSLKLSDTRVYEPDCYTGVAKPPGVSLWHLKGGVPAPFQDEETGARLFHQAHATRLLVRDHLF